MLGVHFFFTEVLKTKIFATTPHTITDHSPPLGAGIFSSILKWFLETNMKQIGAINNLNNITYRTVLVVLLLYHTNFNIKCT